MFTSPENETPAYKAAVSALRELQKQGGSVDRAYADAVYEHTKAWVTKGLKQSSGVPDHLRLLGKRTDYYKLYRTPGFADHTSLWLREGKPFLWVTQPYHLNGEGVRELAKLTDQGFELSISANGSWHFPGATVLVTLKAKTRTSREQGENR